MLRDVARCCEMFARCLRNVCEMFATRLRDVACCTKVNFKLDVIVWNLKSVTW